MDIRLKARGWRGDSVRHALAAKGVSTTVDKNNQGEKMLTVEDISIDELNLQKLYHLTVAGLATDENLELNGKKAKVIQKLNDEADNKNEWIADLDWEKEIFINDPVISDKVDESELNWRESITKKEKERGEETDPDSCVGYIHYHPPAVDEKPTAQDFVLALNIDKLRNESNKEAFRPTAFGVVRDEHLKFYFLTPSDDERKEYLKKFKDIEAGDKKEYFKKVKNQINKMKDNDILNITKEIEYKT